MSLFSNIFGNSEESKNGNIDWKTLKDVSQIDEIVQTSKEIPVVIFKHSTRCSISRMALRQFEQEFAMQGKVTPYFLDLIAYREVSNGIAQRFNVEHQSPQVLLIKDGVSVYNASHERIGAKDLAAMV
jgi:bacillithiol system protein YtxJ